MTNIYLTDYIFMLQNYISRTYFTLVLNKICYLYESQRNIILQLTMPSKTEPLILKTEDFSLITESFGYKKRIVQLRISLIITRNCQPQTALHCYFHCE